MYFSIPAVILQTSRNVSHWNNNTHYAVHIIVLLKGRRDKIAGFEMGFVSSLTRGTVIMQDV